MKRREFILNTASLSAVTIVSPSTAFGTRANSAVSVGIIGCDLRGSAVVTSMSDHST